MSVSSSGRLEGRADPFGHEPFVERGAQGPPGKRPALIKLFHRPAETIPRDWSKDDRRNDERREHSQ